MDNAGRLGFATDGRGDLGLGENNHVTVTDVMHDDDGSTHVRMDRTFVGLPVLGGDLVVHRAADGSWLGASATLTDSLAGLSLTPSSPPWSRWPTPPSRRSAPCSEPPTW